MAEIVPFEIVKQGTPIINQAAFIVLTDDVALIEMDLKTKHCEMYHATSFMADAQNDLTFSFVPPDMDFAEETIIRFSSFRVGWSVFTEMCARYTARITLIRTETYYGQ